MSRAIVNVATGRYLKGQERLVQQFGAADHKVYAYKKMPLQCPDHAARPYVFKAYALNWAALDGFSSLLWCDACIVPGPRPLSDLWEKIERDGYWIARNGWMNYEWTADSAYPDLFPENYDQWPNAALELSRGMNRLIPHVVATAFGISLAHPKGKAILDEYYRLASETNAFCGPWINSNYVQQQGIRDNPRQAYCGPSDVRGHRHDQTALSVIAWRLGCTLSDCPEWFSYKGGETQATCLIADGSY